MKINWSISKIIILGIIIRLLVALFFTHVFDSGNIIAFSKSISDTGTLLPAFNRVNGQLFGRIYYQVIALWMQLLQKIHVININDIFDIPSSTSTAYMQGYPSLAPEVYQYAAIKLVDFLYDFLLLFFLFKIADLFDFKNKKALAFFWALNPILIYVGYVMLQSDLAMIAFLMGGIYFALKALKSQKYKLFSIDRILALVFLAIGSDIKQVPELIVPILLILFSRNILQFIFYGIVYVAAYFLVLQPWSVDAALIKAAFINSQESTNIFLFQLNGVNVFFFLYFAILGYTFKFREIIRKKPIQLVALVCLVISIVLFSEDISYLFPQFNLWIMPLLAILAFYDKNYATFLFLPLIGFFHKAIQDGSMLTATLGATFGEPLKHIPSYDSIISKYINSIIVYKAIDTVFEMLCLALIFYIIYTLLKGKKILFIEDITKSLSINLLKMSFILPLIFLLCGLGEFMIMSHSTQLTNYSFQNIKEITLTKNPIYINIVNPKELTFTGAIMRFNANSPQKNDNTIIKAIDKDTGKTLFVEKINDILLPGGSDYEISFPNYIKSENIKLAVYKENGFNNIGIYAQSSTEPVQASNYPRYDTLYLSDTVHINNTQYGSIDMNMRGDYSFNMMWNKFMKDIQDRRKFFIGYFGLLGILCLSLIFPLKETLSTFKRGIKKIKIFLNYKLILNYIGINR